MADQTAISIDELLAVLTKHSTDPDNIAVICAKAIESLEAENLKLQDIIKDRDAQIVEIGARLEYVQEALK